MYSKNQKEFCLHLKILGRVQGVYFRAWTQEVAEKLSLHGWVRNLGDGSVEVNALGPRDKLETFLNQCHQGPVRAQVTEVLPRWEKAKPNLVREGFKIIYGV